jgi:hypothetical protein
MKFSAAAGAVLLTCVTSGFAQWAKVPDPSLPRTRDGKPNLAARAPRAQDGKPDLSGVWTPELDSTALPPGSTTVESITGFVPPRYFVDISAGMKPGDFSMTPWAADLYNQRQASRGKNDPAAHCQPLGVPAVSATPLPYKIIQTPKIVLILYEGESVFRQIFLDSRPTVEDPQPRFMGYSSGKWEGETLVVNTVGLTDKTWLDALGHPHSEALRLTEKFRRVNVGSLEIEVTIDDPKAYTKPWTVNLGLNYLPDEELIESICDNEKDAQHMVGK